MQNRTTRDLGHAVGEIVLVVTGILIALGVINGNLQIIDKEVRPH